MWVNFTKIMEFINIYSNRERTPVHAYVIRVLECGQKGFTECLSIRNLQTTKRGPHPNLAEMPE